MSQFCVSSTSSLSLCNLFIVLTQTQVPVQELEDYNILSVRHRPKPGERTCHSLHLIQVIDWREPGRQIAQSVER